MSWKSMRSLAVLGLLGLACFAGISLAQLEEQQLGVPTDIEKVFPANKTQFFNILKATQPPTDKDKGILDNAAKYYAWRVTWLEYVNNQDKLAAALKEFDQ